MNLAQSPFAAAPPLAAVAPPPVAPLPFARLLRAYAVEAKFELLGALRTPGFAIPFVAVPIAVYLLFGVVIDAGGEGAIADYLFAGFATMGASMPGIFAGVILAQEREGNLLKLKRALPLPAGATIVAKVAMAMAVGAIAVTLVVAAALLAGKLSMSFAQAAVVWTVLVVGTIPFAAIGLLIGAWSSAAAAPAWGNLVFLPMMWLSGLFIPLPAFLKPWVIVWPTFHLDQLALGLAGVAEFTFIPPSVAAAALLGTTVLCGGLAIRRLARIG